MTGNGISMCTVKESIAALHIHRRHEIDKDDRCIDSCAAWPLGKQQHFWTQAKWLIQCHSFQSPQILTLTPELPTSMSCLSSSSSPTITVGL